MTNTTKLLSREEIEAIRVGYFPTVLPKHSTPFGGCDSDRGILEAKDFNALLAHIEAQEALIGELASIVRRDQDDFCKNNCDALNNDHWEECDEMKALIAKVKTMKEVGNA